MVKNIWKGRPMDDVKITTDIEATDQLGMLVRRIQVESPRKGDLRKQAAAIVEKVTYLGWELKVIEVDGVSDAVQIRSKKPAEEDRKSTRLNSSHITNSYAVFCLK